LRHSILLPKKDLMPMPTTALVVDDEALARAHLSKLLAAQGVHILGEAGDGSEALRLAEDLQPDLLFLDIQMPGLTGMQLAGALQFSSANSHIVFVTGYSEHALQAFDHGALDYLVKPIAAERLAKTLARVRALLASPQRRQDIAQAMPQTVAAGEPLQRLPIRTDYAVRLVRVEEIQWAKSQQKRVVIATKDGEFPTYYTLTQLESLLPADQFFRIHDSCIVRLNLIEEILFLGNHTYGVLLTGGQELPVGRSRYAALQMKLGVGSLPSA
jgi:DNA-binding LytR/AlgR family response regulator